MVADLGGPCVERVAGALRRGSCPSDRVFDNFLAPRWRFASHQHWTPLRVVQRVAEWLEALEVKRVVDVGSGAGKFCVAGALASRCEFIGVEQRLPLVEDARALAAVFGVEGRVQFLHGAFGDCSLPEADAYYIFNPFGENLCRHQGHLDGEVELSPIRYQRDVALMESFLVRAPVGTYVIKYNGFGGDMPFAYDLVCADSAMPCTLRMWQKTGV